MRSIFAKILLWSLGTCALSLIAFAAISFYVVRGAPGPGDFFARTFTLLGDDARLAYEERGRDGLAAVLNRLDAFYPAQHYLTDAQGRDLVNNVDRSSLLSGSDPHPPPRDLPTGQFVVSQGIQNGKYHLIIVVTPQFDPSGILPYFAAIVLAIALLGYALAFHFAAPLRSLRLVVDRFGRGDLSARALSKRKDEIGELSRSFDVMAGRIETLLAAERRLLQDVSHELRSPLARLGFAIEIARSGDDRESALNRIKKDVDRLSTLVDELLQLTRAEGDPSSRNIEPTELVGLLQTLVDDCALEARARSLTLLFHADRPGALSADRELLHRALENVLRNAIRHAPNGTAVELELSHHDDQALITIRDYGPGVPEDALEAIFQPFLRVGDDRSRSSGGTGLGLSIARRSISLHQGKVTAQNACPGLRVTIELPYVEAPVRPSVLA